MKHPVQCIKSSCQRNSTWAFSIPNPEPTHHKTSTILVHSCSSHTGMALGWIHKRLGDPESVTVESFKI